MRSAVLLTLLVAAIALGRPSAAEPAAPEPMVPAARVPGEYQIGPDDILRITVFGHVDLTQTVVVQADGTFLYPLISRVQAAGRTPKEVETTITEELARSYIRNPQVTVVVQEYRSKMVSVVGEVTRPGSYPLTGNDTVVELLSKAGPLSQNAGSEVLIIRALPAPASPPEATSGTPAPAGTLPAGLPDTGGAPAEVLHISLRDIQQGRLEKNLLLQPNDTVFVPEATRVFVSGEVRNPGAYPFSGGTTVRQAISLAGGLTSRGSGSRVRVVRTIDGKAKEHKVGLDDLVEPGDTIVVKERIF
jgi:polysaccharide export outer membrane protein